MSSEFITTILARASYLSANAIYLTENHVIISAGDSVSELETISSDPDGDSDLPDMLLYAAITPAPEPVTMLLFGVGLAGHAELTLRQNKNLYFNKSGK